MLVTGPWGGTQREPRLTDQSFPDRVKNDLGGIVHIQLLHQVCAVTLYCVGTYVQQCGHFFVCSSFGEQLEHLFFSRSQEVKCIRESLLPEHPHVILQQDLVDGLAEKGLS